MMGYLTKKNTRPHEACSDSLGKKPFVVQGEESASSQEQSKDEVSVKGGLAEGIEKVPHLQLRGWGEEWK